MCLSVDTFVWIHVHRSPFIHLARYYVSEDMEKRGEGSIIRTNFISQMAPLSVAFVSSDPQGYSSISKDVTNEINFQACSMCRIPTVSCFTELLSMGIWVYILVYMVYTWVYMIYLGVYFGVYSILRSRFGCIRYICMYMEYLGVYGRG
jgi:hypothetical protein